MSTENSIQSIPPAEDPRSLTARPPVSTLRDHFLSFLNANNPSGFRPEEVVALNAKSIGDLMLFVATNDYLTEKKLKSWANKIKNCPNTLFRIIGRLISLLRYLATNTGMMPINA
ncbi:hypothetical protein PQR37_33935 [Paraburkholderia nemoris]|uniref:hypothetical protein n=1 Tax=Paraburkholderia nemoris TaxID=2793076 RepID=UPI0038BA67F5